MTSEGKQSLKCSDIVDPIDFTHTSIKREDLGMCIIIVTLTKSKGILKNCIFPNSFIYAQYTISTSLLC